MTKRVIAYTSPEYNARRYRIVIQTEAHKNRNRAYPTVNVAVEIEFKDALGESSWRDAPDDYLIEGFEEAVISLARGSNYSVKEAMKSLS